jgi:hypothetical protein
MRAGRAVEAARPHTYPRRGLPIIGKLLDKHVVMFSRSLLDGAQTLLRLSWFD